MGGAARDPAGVKRNAAPCNRENKQQEDGSWLGELAFCGIGAGFIGSLFPDSLLF